MFGLDLVILQANRYLKSLWVLLLHVVRTLWRMQMSRRCTFRCSSVRCRKQIDADGATGAFCLLSIINVHQSSNRWPITITLIITRPFLHKWVEITTRRALVNTLLPANSPTLAATVTGQLPLPSAIHSPARPSGTSPSPVEHFYCENNRPPERGN